MTEETKKDKAKITKGLKCVDRAEDNLSESVETVASALDQGAKKYRKKREDSAAKKKDGALLDFAENVAGGVSETVSKASPVIEDLTNAVVTKRVKKQVRKAVKIANSLNPFSKI